MRDLEFKRSVMHFALKRNVYLSGSRAKRKREWQKRPGEGGGVHGRRVQGARTSERRDSVTCARDSPRHVNRAPARRRQRNRRKKGRRTAALVNGRSMDAGHYFPGRETRGGGREGDPTRQLGARRPTSGRAPVASGINVQPYTRDSYGG